jgi:uncharacterized membrane protein YtjA (UPF0391 family)
MQVCTSVERVRHAVRFVRGGAGGIIPAPQPREELIMLHWAVVFFVIAIIAALFGFGGIAVGAAGVAKILFFGFLLLAVISLIASVARRA